MNKKIPIIVIAIVLAGGLTGLLLIKSHKATPAPPSAVKTSTEVLPVQSNPIQNSNTTPGLAITAAAVEDNADPKTKQPISDRLQITVQNTSSQTMANLEIYYEMKDATTGQHEAYYQKLNGLQLLANESKTIYFDNESGANHYPENKYSLYRSSKNQVDFTIQISTPGFKIAPATAKKSAGTGETAG